MNSDKQASAPASSPNAVSSDDGTCSRRVRFWVAIVGAVIVSALLASAATAVYMSMSAMAAEAAQQTFDDTVTEANGAALSKAYGAGWESLLNGMNVDGSDSGGVEAYDVSYDKAWWTFIGLSEADVETLVRGPLENGYTATRVAGDKEYDLAGASAGQIVRECVRVLQGPSSGGEFRGMCGFRVGGEGGFPMIMLSQPTHRGEIQMFVQGLSSDTIFEISPGNS